MSRDIQILKNTRKPSWFRIRPPTTEKFTEVKGVLKKRRLTTVCEESHCPNISECWSGGTATFMVLGDTCTRGCRFCNIKTARKGQPVDPNEPQKLVKAIQELNIFDYIVITSVDRDELPDQGSGHFAKCVRAVKEANPDLMVEVLIPDLRGDVDLLKTIVDAKPDVIAHNIETVRGLTPQVRDRRANYEQSLKVLENVKKLDPSMVTKSSIMVGLGEMPDQVMQSMHDLKEVGCDILTIGQYLRPSKRHLEVKTFVHPDTFEFYKDEGEQRGFAFVASGPFVRSSYRAGELFIKNIVQRRRTRLCTKESVKEHA